MTKRYLVVHECGHIVKPGDRIKLADNAFNKRNPLVDDYGEYEFVGLADVDFYAKKPSYKFLKVMLIDDEGNPYTPPITRTRRVDRFDCSIVEVDYDEQPT